MVATVGVAGWVGLGVYWAEGLAERGRCPSVMFTPPGEISMYAFAIEKRPGNILVDPPYRFVGV